ncbi:hypothetical protein JCM10914A_24820 [Paenibacillus sp. JCM 10914]|uniref:ankyrin repeat domain-containing protein n=1 Tax=Paenibacillus sp. JCM 10914 TaxID=1236974 RepID=UPI0005622626|nr:ankyrin repeat domain-containing protein [Paenibacillus sp. JCM 10914]
MKKRLTSIPAFAMGAIVGVTLTAGSAVGAAVYLKATPSLVDISVDDTPIRWSAPPVIIQDKLYVPIREMSDALGYQLRSATNQEVDIVSRPSKGSEGTTIPSSPATIPGGNLHVRDFVKDMEQLILPNNEFKTERLMVIIAAGEADLESRDAATGNSILHYLILHGETAAYDTLKQIDGQAGRLDYNLQNFEGQTPLHLAVIHERDAYIDKLLNLHKVDATTKDNEGKTALDYAEADSPTHKKLTTYLSSHSK